MIKRRVIRYLDIYIVTAISTQRKRYYFKSGLVIKETELVKNINHISIFARNDKKIIPDIVAHHFAFAWQPSGSGTQR
jgi:hypothetical protein